VAPDQDAERAANVVRAYRLHAQRWSSREIGEELGVSHTTARRYVEEYRQAAEWTEVQERAGRRARMVEFLNELARRGVEALEGNENKGLEPQPYDKVTPALMRVVTEINRVEGNYAPTRVVTEDDRRPPDPLLVEAMREEAARATALDEDEVRRELEQ
jgi:hypothetical protein